MSDWRQSTAHPPFELNPFRRGAAPGACSAQVAARMEIFREHLRRVSWQRSSPIEPPEHPGMVEMLDLLEEIGVEPIHFFAELIQLWRADPRLWPTDGREEEEV